ncbi:MAG: hypothetical protein JNM75_02260 [Rhodospirillales bacterium]|nr:hypothetical protein [Rhodospirillales bacterium]
MGEETAEDLRIGETAAQLRAMKQALGDSYWQDEEVHALQQTLRRLIGSYGAWGENRLPMHQRARAAARLESENADLLWPGRASGG